MTEATIDIDHLRQWIGRTEAAVDTVSPRLVAGYLAVLDDPTPERAVGEPAPLAIHWCLAPAIRPMSQLGLDGHPQRGGLLPPVPLPHRMWAGGKMDLHARLEVGDVVTRQSTVRDVTLKTGRSGALCFVTVDHAFTSPRGLAVRDRNRRAFPCVEHRGNLPFATQLYPEVEHARPRIRPDNHRPRACWMRWQRARAGWQGARADGDLPHRCRGRHIPASSWPAAAHAPQGPHSPRR